MTFEQPWILAGLAAAVLPLLLGFLRIPARRVRVPTLMLWRQVPVRIPPLREMRRPRPSLGQILATLAIACGVLAMARPGRVLPRPLPRHLILVVDTSPRLLTRHADGRTAFEHAVAHATALLRGLEPADRVTVVARQRTLEIHRTDPDGAASVLQTLQAGFLPADLSASLDRARELRAEQEDSEILVLTDRPVPGYRASLHGVPESDNIGIAGLAVTTREIFVRIVNAGSPRRARLLLGDRPEDLDIPAGDLGLVRQREEPGPVRVLLEPQDNLPEDNEAWSTRLTGGDTLSVTIREGIPREDLRRALHALPAVRLEDPGAVDVEIVDRAEPGPAAVTARIVIAPEQDVPPVRVGPPAPREELVWADHPIMREIQFGKDQLRPGNARSLVCDEAAFTPLLSAGNVPIMGIVDAPGRILLVIGFDPLSPESGWSKMPSFPVFWAAVFEHIRRRIGREADLVLRAGEPVDLARLPGVSGASHPAEIAHGHLLCPRPAVARLETPSGGIDARFNLLEETVSLNAGEHDPWQGPLFNPDRPPRRARLDLQVWFLLACTVFLAASLAASGRRS